MKSTKTRILSLLLVACMLLSVMAPAVFAADPEPLVYTFNHNVAGKSSVGHANVSDSMTKAGDDVLFGEGSADTWQYMARSINTYTRVIMYALKANGTTNGIKFSTANSTNEPTVGSIGAGAWFAIKLNNVPDAVYSIALKSDAKAVTATDVYVMPASVFETSAAYQLYKNTGADEEFPRSSFPTDGSGKSIIELMDELLVTDAVTKAGTYELAAAGTDTFDNITLAGDANDSYVLVFKDITSAAMSMFLSSVTLNKTGDVAADTVEAKIGDKEYATVEEALEKAEEGQTVVLQAAATAAEAITVKAGTILDLNGQELTANGGLTCFGTVTDNKDGAGKIKGANVVLKTDAAHLVIGNAADGYGVYAGSVVCASAKGNKAEGVKFTFGLKNAVNAYAAIATYGLEVTAGLKVDGQDVDVTPVFAQDLVKEWAEQGAGFGIYVKVTGLENVQNSLVLTPTIGNLTGSAITYTAQ